MTLKLNAHNDSYKNKNKIPKKNCNETIPNIRLSTEILREEFVINKNNT